MARGTEDTQARQLKAKELYLAGVSLTDIAAHPEIQRSIPAVFTWKERGKWDDERARRIAKQTGKELIVSPSARKAVNKILDVTKVDLESGDAMSDQDINVVMTTIVKGLFKRVLVDLESGNVSYKNPTQIHSLLELILKETHLSRGEPTEIHEKRGVNILPEDDVKAIREGLSRLKQIADRRKQSIDEDIIEVELIDE